MSVITGTVFCNKGVLVVLRERFGHIFKKPEMVFLSIVLPFGLIMVFLMPFFSVPDEYVHFYRAYQVSQGGLVSQNVNQKTGGQIPTEIQEDINTRLSDSAAGVKVPTANAYRSYFTHRINTKVASFVDFRTSALYSPVAYVPQSIGIGLAKAIYPSLGFMVVMGRLANLAAYILLIFFAIRLANNSKWVYASLGLFPIAIQQGASLSSDVMTIGIAFVWIALMQNLFTQKQMLTKGQLLLSLILVTGIALTKQTNVLLVLPLLFLPKLLFSNTKSKLKFIFLTVGLTITLSLLWFFIMALNHYQLQISSDPFVSSSMQLSGILRNPLNFISVLWHTYVFEGFHPVPGLSPDFYIISMEGVFSYISYKLPLSLVLLGYAGLLLSFLHKENTDKLVMKKFPLTVTQTATGILSFVAIATALYLTWSPVGQKQVSGIQGRYFLSVIPLFIPLFILLRTKIGIVTSSPYSMGIIIGIVSCINLVAMVGLTRQWFY